MTPERAKAVAWHVSQAVIAWGAYCRARGATAPPELEAVARLAAALGGMEGPPLAEVAAFLNSLVVEQQPLLLTYAQAARVLGLSERSVRMLASRGDLPVARIGRAARLHRADVERFADGLRGSDRASGGRVGAAGRAGAADPAAGGAS